MHIFRWYWRHLEQNIIRYELMPCLCVTSSLGGVDGACGHWASPAWSAGSAQSVVKGQEWTCTLPEHQLLNLHWLHQSSGWYWAHFPLIIILWCLHSHIYNSQNLKTGLFFRNVTVVCFRHIYWKLAWIRDSIYVKKKKRPFWACTSYNFIT